MKAIVVSQYGDPEVLSYQDADIGKPGKGQVLVRLAYAGVNFVEIYQRRGTYPRTLPYIPGSEASGIIEAVGEGVEDFKVGDHVAYVHQPGAYAEASIINAKSLIPLPSSFSLEQGAAFPLQGMTAHYLLHEFRKPKQGDVVLIHAAAGGMGLLLVQWARHLGARVIGTVSTEEKAKAARQAGATDVILYNEKDFAVETKRLTDGHGADLIIDGVGKTTFKGNLEAAALRGHIVIYGAASGPAEPIPPNALMVRSLTVSGGSLPNYLLTRDEMLQRAHSVIKGIQEGWLKLTIDKVIPLDQVAEAHRLLENRQTIGKIVLKIKA
ncbi:quinone oxidoreductase family protein [Parachlamydia acanthamoebae]|uniref:quinone oxidoreductase family protein n=1 Tax=Parachlamydia acanthamoebae TaxID=83552 RepID=UPI0007519755|nr:quinone oxidoreductase [Parachlamydia acanthamoebae]